MSTATLTRTPYDRKVYAAQRAAGNGARIALTLARFAMTPVAQAFRDAGYPCPDDRVTLDGPTGITVRITLRLDDAGYRGAFSDEWSAYAIQVPSWRPSDAGRRFRYYEPEHGMTLREWADDLRRTHGRHDAWNLAVQYARDECRNAADGRYWGIEVEVLVDGEAVADGSLWGVEVGEDDAWLDLAYVASDVVDDTLYGVAVDMRDAADAAERRAAELRATADVVRDAGGLSSADLAHR